MSMTTSPPSLASTCPACGHATPLVLDCAALDWALLIFTCPACHQSWRSITDRDSVTRYAVQPA